MKTHSSLAGHNTYELAVYHWLGTVHFPLGGLPAPNPTHTCTQLARPTVSQGDQPLDG